MTSSVSISHASWRQRECWRFIGYEPGATRNDSTSDPTRDRVGR
jgi:hypothetical protein